MNNYMKKIIKRYVPKCIIKVLRFVPPFLYLLNDSWYWLKNDLRHSSLGSTEKSDLASLLITSHVLEKGITMPNRRLGFGYERTRNIIHRCKSLIDKYSADHIEIQSCLKDLEQYLQLHKQENFELPLDIIYGIEKLLTYKNTDTIPCFEATPELFFKRTEDFKDFAHSRHSVRWYSDEKVDKDSLINAIELAQTAPSACNRQSVKVYVIDSEDKKTEVLKLQNGNRGFGHLADKILLITSNMNCWNYRHRPMAYIDGGIFIQNLLYALHYYKICACTLNAGLTNKERKRLQKIVGYTSSEIPLVFISIGKAPEHFMIAGSQRLDVEDIYNFV